MEDYLPDFLAIIKCDGLLLSLSILKIEDNDTFVVIFLVVLCDVLKHYVLIVKPLDEGLDQFDPVQPLLHLKSRCLLTQLNMDPLHSAQKVLSELSLELCIDLRLQIIIDVEIPTLSGHHWVSTLDSDRLESVKSKEFLEAEDVHNGEVVRLWVVV